MIFASAVAGFTMAPPYMPEWRSLAGPCTLISKYASPRNDTAAAVGISLTDRELMLVVTDNGRGLPADGTWQEQDGAATDAAPSYGLTGMRQRVASLRGCMDLQSTPPDGTGAALTIRIPIDHAGPR